MFCIFKHATARAQCMTVRLWCCALNIWLHGELCCNVVLMVADSALSSSQWACYGSVINAVGLFAANMSSSAATPTALANGNLGTVKAGYDCCADSKCHNAG
jgi:hypothetical protein